MTPHIPGTVYLNAALMRLPAFKVKERKKNTCNLSQKEGSSLSALLAKRQRMTWPKNLHLHMVKLFIFLWPVDMQFRKQPHRLNKKCVSGENTQPCGWRWPHGSPLPGRHSAQGTDITRELSTRGQCSTLLSPSGFSEVLKDTCCRICWSFIQDQDQICTPTHLGVKWHFSALTGLNATSFMEGSQTLNKGKEDSGNEKWVCNSFSLEKGIYCYCSVWTGDWR